MRITKFGHACVRVEYAAKVVVLDPGVFTAAEEALDGADAVLITHEHPDHYLVEHLRLTDAPVFTVAAVAENLRADAPDVAERTTVVHPGDSFDPGIPTRVVGELHAVIHPELDRVTNSGYVLSGDSSLYHPGDALTPPGEAVDLLLLPVSAPWLKLSEAIDFARVVGAPHSVAIHDRIYSEVGLGIVDAQLQAFLAKDGLDYSRLADGDDVG